MMGFGISGVYCATVTPLNADLSPDLKRLGAHCQNLLAEGCHGIALLGTTGEANSFSVAERKAILEGALAAGITPEQLAPGVGVAAIPDTVELTRHALSLGISRVVMLPPFYYKGVSDDGIFAAYARIIEAVADPRLKLILYHIPQTSAVPLSRPLVTRLIAAFPGIVVGLKDSSGDYGNMQGLVEDNPGFAVMVGADPLLLPFLKIGGAGCITATSNLAARALRTIYDHHADPARANEVDAAQGRIEAARAMLNSYGQIPTIKAVLAERDGDDGWSRVRPPLMPFAAEKLGELRERVAALPAL
ncbi:dihydrodipicolinate synthetase [Devosia sp. Root105]|nr:dihydrodipicolinate synthetase [Devosia sp. Root105]